MKMVDVGQKEPARTGGGRKAGDGRCVQMQGPVGHRSLPEGHLAQQRVAWPDERHEVGPTAAIAGVHEARPISGIDAERVTLGRVGHEPSLDLNPADFVGADRQRPDVEGTGAEPLLAVEVIETALEVGRATDHHSTWRLTLEQQVVTERDEVDEVVGVEVADQHGVEIGRVRRGSKPRKGTLSQVEKQAGPTELDEVGGTRGADAVRVGRPRACDEEVHQEMRSGSMLVA